MGTTVPNTYRASKKRMYFFTTSLMKDRSSRDRTDKWGSLGPSSRFDNSETAWDDISVLTLILLTPPLMQA